MKNGIHPEPMILERAALTGLLLSSTLTGASFYRWARTYLERRYRQHGVYSYRASLPQAELHYWAGGSGDKTPLLLVHGFGADALWGWAEQIRLADDRFVVAPDLVWFGESHTNVADYSTTFQAANLADLLDHLALDQVDVVGISYGGFVALELAHGWPDRVRRAVVVDSPGHTFTLDDYQVLLERNDIDSVSDLIVPERPADVQRLLQLAFYRPPPVPNFVARDLFTNMFNTWREQKVRLLDNLLARAHGIDPDLYKLDQDLLLLWGSHDVLFPPELAHRLARKVGPNARVSVLPKTNHAPNLERARLFNKRLVGFLDR